MVEEQDREPGPKKRRKWWRVKSKTESQGQRSSRNGGGARQRARAKEVQEMVEGKEQDREPGPKKFKKWWRVKSKTESQGQRSSRNGGR